MAEKKIRLFLSHASEDKEDFVRPLRDQLLKEGFDPWYDEDSLIVGQSLLQQISRGLKSSNYGIVVLSPHFFIKKWPQEELDGLFALETKERKLIIPIWHNVTVGEVREYSAILAGRVASISAKGIDQVIADIKKAVAFVERDKEVTDPLKAKFAAIDQTASQIQKFQQLSRTEKGTGLVLEEISNLFSSVEANVAELRGTLKFPIVRGPHSPQSYIMVYGPDYRWAPNGSRMTLVLRFDVRKAYPTKVSEACLEQRFYFETTELSTEKYTGMALIAEFSYSPFFTGSDQVVWLDQFRNSLSSEYIVTQALSSFGNFVHDLLEGRGVPYNPVQPTGYLSPS
jgi:hypothetical protein